MRRTATFTTLALLLLTLFAAACKQQGETWQRIEEEGILRVGLDPTYPPFETAEGGELRGIDVDLARALADELGLEAEFVYFGFDGLYDALATEQVDVLISALVIRVEQTRDFAFSEPYFNAGQILIVPAENQEIQEMADLNGHTLGVELGAEGHVIATEWERRLPDFTVVPYNLPQEALDGLQQGESDAVLIDAISGRLYLKEHSGLRALDEAVTVEPFAMVVRRDDQILLENLNRALERLEESGRLEMIIESWLGANDAG
jgi:polar amino acid transport system substrate-binding protein